MSPGLLGCVLAACFGLQGTPTRGGLSLSDRADLFGPNAERQATEALREVAVPVAIESIKSLQGRTIEDLASERARGLPREGIYVLIAENDRKIDVKVGPEFRDRVGHDQAVAIRDAFIAGLRDDDPDKALRDGVRQIASTLAVRPARAETPRRAEGDSRRNDDDPPLVARGAVHLQLRGAETILAAARRKAAELNLKVNVAVVDDGGHLLAFARMDGARPASGYTAITKATTAATFRAPTGPLPPGTTDPNPLLNLSLQNAAAASGGKITTLYGGVPVMVDGQVIGAVGVGGGTGEQDAEIARAGIAALMSELGEPAADAARPR